MIPRIKKLHEYFDRSYLINLDSRQDRLLDSTRECNKYGIKFERFRACDGHKELSDIISAESIDMLPRHWNKGNAGLCVSTISILKQCQQDNLNSVLIMEDDIQFNPEIYDILDDAMTQIPEDWESIFFGLTDFSSVPISKNVNLIQSAYSAHCFALRRKVFQFIIDLLSTMSCPNDVAYDRNLFPRGKSYVIKPHLAWQRPSVSNITGRFSYQRLIIPDKYKNHIDTDNMAKSNIPNLIDIIMEGEEQVVILERKVFQLTQKLNRMEQRLRESDALLSDTRNSYGKIYNIYSWRLAKGVHQIINNLFPMGSRRRIFIRQIWIKLQQLQKK